MPIAVIYPTFQVVLKQLYMSQVSFYAVTQNLVCLFSRSTLADFLSRQIHSFAWGTQNTEMQISFSDVLDNN